jgi:Chaperone of endosialidase
MKLRIGCVLVGFLVLALFLAAQTASGGSTSSQVPPLIQFSNVASDEGGDSLSGVVNITFSLYNCQQGGQPLWVETQNNVQLDATGHYSVQLGITKPNGVPTTLFTTGEARWLGVKIAQQLEQPRVLLLSVPYALKAGDAETIGGLPPSAFVLAAPNAAASSSGVEPTTAQGAPPPSGDVTGTGKINYLPLWDSTSDIISSVLFQKGTGSTAKLGINTATPATTLDVKGAGTIRGTLSLPATGAATATAGKNSQPLNLAASAFNSTSSTAVNQTFQWQAEPAGNDTSTPSGTLNLLFGEGATKPSETGLNIASNGQITFATGQTFPGTGDGTVTSVATGLGLAGGPITGSGTLTIDTTVVPQLNTANTFSGNQTVNGNLTATNVTATQTVSAGVVNATTSFNLGGYAFAYGSTANQNAFLGFAGNPVMTGTYNTATGYSAFASNSTGGGNTANGSYALLFNTTGSYNTASGSQALGSNSTGGNNTASGYQALYENTTGSYNTATGTYALIANSTGASNTASGYQALYSNSTGNYNTASGNQTLYSNNTGFGNTAAGAAALASNTAGSYNTATGTQALYSNTTANGNTATGNQTLYSNTTGGNNTASGAEALESNTTGSQNTASGALTLVSNSTGVSNTATGYQALYYNTTANGNTATGNQALFFNTTGASNTASGAGALQSNTTGDHNTASGIQALNDNTTGADNTAVGAGALQSNTTGSGLTCIGFGCSAGEDGLSNATAIGAHAVVGASNALVLGGTGAYAVKVGIGTETPSSVLTIAQGAGNPVSDGWETFSSRRWKTNIQTLHGALGKVEQMRGVSYDLKANGKHEVGVIAEEVGAVVPELVSYEENGKDARSVDYSRLTALLIEATKEQQTAFCKQQAELAKALRQIRQQQNLLRAQGAVVRSLQAEVRETRDSLRMVKVQVGAAQPTLVAAK